MTAPTPQDARTFAIQAHGDQRYGVHPYSVHLDMVASIVAPFGDEAQIIAYLHDVVEDTSIALDDVARLFGPRTARCVDLLTDQPGHNRKTRKAATYARLRAVQHSDELPALLVKTADRLANIRSCVQDNNLGKLKMYTKEHSVFYHSAYRPGLCDALWNTMHTLIPSPTPHEQLP